MRILLLLVAIVISVPHAASAGTTYWDNSPTWCWGSAAQFLVVTNPNVTRTYGKYSPGCTHGRIVTYVKLFATNYSYDSGKVAISVPPGGFETIYVPPGDAYGNPNGMFVYRWVGSTQASTFVAP